MQEKDAEKVFSLFLRIKRKSLKACTWEVKAIVRHMSGLAKDYTEMKNYVVLLKKGLSPRKIGALNKVLNDPDINKHYVSEAMPWSPQSKPQEKTDTKTTTSDNDSLENINDLTELLSELSSLKSSSIDTSDISLDLNEAELAELSSIDDSDEPGKISVKAIEPNNMEVDKQSCTSNQNDDINDEDLFDLVNDKMSASQDSNPTPDFGFNVKNRNQINLATIKEDADSKISEEEQTSMMIDDSEVEILGELSCKQLCFVQVMFLYLFDTSLKRCFVCTHFCVWYLEMISFYIATEAIDKWSPLAQNFNKNSQAILERKRK